MTNFALYLHRPGLAEVERLLTEQLPKAEVSRQGSTLTVRRKGGLFGKTRTLTVSYRQRNTPSYTLERVEDDLTRNLSGMVSYIRSLPTEHADIRDRLVYKAMAANVELGCTATPEMDEVFGDALRAILREMNGFVFASADPYFSASDQQQFLDAELRLILDAVGESDIENLEVTVDSKYHDVVDDELSEQQLKRRERSNERPRSHGVKVHEGLPCIEDERRAAFRSVEEVINRAYALLLTAAKGEGIDQVNLDRVKQEKNITSLSPEEQVIYDAETPTDQQRIYASWRYESLHTLLWALGQVAELSYPSDTCDVRDTVTALLEPSREEFTAAARLRSPQELLDATDLIYRMHWACVDARLRNEEVGGNLDCGVVYERHYSLNWLINVYDEAWDEVRTDT